MARKKAPIKGAFILFNYFTDEGVIIQFFDKDITYFVLKVLPFNKDIIVFL